LYPVEGHEDERWIAYAEEREGNPSIPMGRYHCDKRTNEEEGQGLAVWSGKGIGGIDWQHSKNGLLDNQKKQVNEIIDPDVYEARYAILLLKWGEELAFLESEKLGKARLLEVD